MTLTLILFGGHDLLFGDTKLLAVADMQCHLMGDMRDYLRCLSDVSPHPRVLSFTISQSQSDQCL